MLSTLGLQRATPDDIRGRVFSFDYGLVTLTIALSVLLAGFLSETLAPQAAVWTMVGLIAIAGTAWIWFSTPARRAAAYTEAQTLKRRAGRAHSEPKPQRARDGWLEARTVDRPRRTTRERPENRSGHRPLARHSRERGLLIRASRRRRVEPREVKASRPVDGREVVLILRR